MEHGPTSMCCWASQDPVVLGRLLQGISQSVLQGRSGSTIVVVGADPLLSTCSAGDFLDLWSHPMLHAKWQAFFADLAIADMPRQVVALGDHTPHDQ